ncbi:MAG: hypothetical protein HY043_12375 [Verrucomicrobia bacterium]|nr:hypothetical protein [Verrucomicrobiota bacterium]
MNKPLIIRPELIKQLLALPLAQRKAAWESLSLLSEAFGHPHSHSGLGIRKLRPHLFECRVGLNLRLLFKDRDMGVEVFWIGNHDQMQTFLRNYKYD